VSDCIFCKIAAGQIPSQKVFENDHVFAFYDISPQAPQHVLIIPKQHIAKLADTADTDVSILGNLLIAARSIATSLGMDEQSYRVVINNGEQAGQSVWHLHAHLLSGRPFGWPPG
jgi:histidine triad (HIT) family protein